MASSTTRLSLATAFLFLSLLLIMNGGDRKHSVNALVPWLSAYDIDPFKILEQTPFPADTQTPPLTTSMALPRADWGETSKEHVIAVDVPGLKKEDIKIEVEDNRVLRISGERKIPKEDEEEGKGGDQSVVWHRAERSGGRFWRRFRLPMNADLDKVKAHLEDGVLKIRVPKLAEDKKRQPRLIEISSSPSSAGVQDIQATKADQ